MMWHRVDDVTQWLADLSPICKSYGISKSSSLSMGLGTWKICREGLPLETVGALGVTSSVISGAMAFMKSSSPWMRTVSVKARSDLHKGHFFDRPSSPLYQLVYTPFASYREYSYSSVWTLLEDELDLIGIYCTWMCHEAMCVGQVEASCPYSTLTLNWYLFGFLSSPKWVDLIVPVCVSLSWKVVVHHHSHFQRYGSHLVCDLCLLYGWAVIPTLQIFSCFQPSKTLDLDQWRRPVI